MSDIEKLSAFWNRKKRKKKKSWTMKFASSIKTKIEDNDLGDRLAIGFARMMSRRGF